MNVFYKETPWLLVFLGGFGNEETTVKTALHTTAASTGLAKPRYKLVRFPADKTLQFPSGVPLANEITTLFFESVLKDLIQGKSEMGTSKAVLILHRNAFPTELIFRQVVYASRRYQTIYHMICTRGNLLNDARCYRTPCSLCNQFVQGTLDHQVCMDSCLRRLLWLMFDEKAILAEQFDAP